MQKNIFIVIISLVAIAGCKQKKTISKKPETTAGTNFFPVTQYLLGQIKELHSLEITPLKILTVKGSKDSVWIKREAIQQIVQPFTTPVIDSSLLHNYFTETSFLDQSINAFTFSYDPIRQLPDTLELKRWDVYIDPATSKVKRIYIVKQINNSSSQQTVQLTWQSGYYCQVTTITEKKETAPEIKEEKLIWNFDDK